MKRQKGAEATPTRSYGAAKLTPEQKEMVARLYDAWQARGKPRDDFVSLFAEAGFFFDVKTLGRWISRLDSGEPVTSATKAAGRPRALDNEQFMVLVGFVLESNDKIGKCAAEDGKMFLKWCYKLDLSIDTVLRYYGDACLSRRVQQDKNVSGDLLLESLDSLANQVRQEVLPGTHRGRL